MKKIFTLLLCCIFILSSGYSQKREIDNDGKYKGIIRIKFSPKSDKKVNELHQLLINRSQSKTKSTEEFVRTNIANLDKVNQQFKANKMRRVFRDAGKFEAKHKEFGLHLWYEVEFNTSTPVSQLIKSYQNVAEISMAEGINATKQIEGVKLPERNNTPAPTALPAGTNDPRFVDQWHYENTGQNNGTPGADISLLDAWQVETGNPNVIVAIEDGGVDYDHEDLAANMWINPGEIAGNGIDDDNNGYVDDIYGYNFADNTGDIYVGDHGTHVAGTVAAVSNNGIGVSGIAGGSGNNDGVKLMSCNVFSASSGGFAEAYSYAADNGAVISQNSWSYTSPYQYDQAVLDGIDYFIANAGGANAPMNGGIVIFAAGNDNSQSRYYPAYYSNVLAVASTNKNDVKAYYSNYGTWVDIAAPGGELETTNEDPTAVLSTFPNDTYGVFQGTSMACPHVSGVAALVVSKYAGNITPAELRTKLVDNTDPIDDLNTSYAGKLGSGRLNAYKALTNDNLPSVPSGLAASNVTQTSFTIGWNAVSGAVSYDVQIREQGGAWQTINTSQITCDYSGAVAETTYEFQVRANNDAGSSSYSAIASVVTEAAPTVPVAPANLTASNITYNSFSISWDAVTDADNYDLDVRPVGGTWTTVNLSNPNYDYNGLNAETTYEFQVRANNSIGSSVNSNLVSATTLAAPTAPTAPANVTASDITYHSFTITWDVTTDAVDYDLNVRPAGGTWSTINLSTTSYNYNGLNAETNYEFQVRANNSVGSSDYSNIETATTLAAPSAPATPINLAASNITYNSFTISWDAVVNADDYDLDIRVTGGTWSNFNTSLTTYNYTSALASTNYEFRVRSNNEIGSGDYSSIESLTTDQIPVPEIPTGLAASNITSNSFSLSWNSIEFADNYDLQIREQGGNWELFTTSATSFDYSTAMAETTYEYQVLASNSSGSSAYTSIQSFTTLAESTTPDYCESYGQATRYEYIDLVELANMNNPSGDDGGYGDYTNMTASVKPGNSYTLNFSLGYKSRSYTANWRIYIDFNRDGEFTSNEIIVSGYTASAGISSSNITIPANAAIGKTRMRVMLKHRRAAKSGCEIFSQGEVEDYTVDISNTAPAPATKSSGLAFGNPLSETPPIEELKLYPNPAKNFVTLYIQGNIQSKVRISSLTGKTIQILTLDQESNSIDISNLPSGMYFISIEDGDEIISKKLIKL
ncbi:S8 family serine peptidase [Labilibaculum sp. A4]|uniref:fibronectin type III domain-containing protein n=1 Tax=Labilibaculum euxinus TaxID=2686357 RepID=UPI000F61C310|nr:S8 family serine peptidase [Labilibaculum euxinus]MDQ1769254.1 S8 family serine peptidase [Labilibaculum euxinus]MWN74778.1 S8 family serine peptidase [Labilibaculum euxinus]